jgi:hypothetical protein
LVARAASGFDRFVFRYLSRSVWRDAGLVTRDYFSELTCIGAIGDLIQEGAAFLPEIRPPMKDRGAKGSTAAQPFNAIAHSAYRHGHAVQMLSISLLQDDPHGTIANLLQTACIMSGHLTESQKAGVARLWVFLFSTLPLPPACRNFFRRALEPEGLMVRPIIEPT